MTWTRQRLSRPAVDHIHCWHPEDDFRSECCGCTAWRQYVGNLEVGVDEQHGTYIQGTGTR